MAIWLTKSRTMAQYLRQKVGLLRILSGQSCSSTIIPLRQCYPPSLPILIPSKTLFSPGRSKSTVAANRLDSLFSSDADDDHQVNIIIFNPAFCHCDISIYALFAYFLILWLLKDCLCKFVKTAISWENKAVRLCL